jgi:hypothetical protein
MRRRRLGKAVVRTVRERRRLMNGFDRETVTEDECVARAAHGGEPETRMAFPASVRSSAGDDHPSRARSKSWYPPESEPDSVRERRRASSRRRRLDAVAVPAEQFIACRGRCVRSRTAGRRSSSRRNAQLRPAERRNTSSLYAASHPSTLTPVCDTPKRDPGRRTLPPRNGAAVLALRLAAIECAAKTPRCEERRISLRRCWPGA